MDANAWLVAVTGDIDGFLYTYILLALLVIAGIYFTIRTKAVQLRYIKDMFTQITEKKHVEGERSISSFQALMVSTASRVGTGNIAGVATALATGGPGAVFCGPAYYIHQALGSRGLGVLFSILLILCFAFGFNGLQAFNATSALEYYLPAEAMPKAAVASGIVLAAMTAMVIFGGTKRISVITSIVVPVMALGYIAIAVWTTIANITWLPAVFGLVFQSAFDFQSIFGGFAGSVVMLGIKRGLYSNEAGMGSAPNAAATASVSHPVKQGLVQSLSVYIDTLLICTCSAMMVLVFYVQDPETAMSLNGMPLVQLAVNNSVGEIGIHFITFAIFAFAFSSLIGNYFYAESNLRFIKGDSKALLTVFRIVCLLVIFYGATNSFDLAWNIADIFMGLMAIVNLIAILLLGKWAFAALDDYTKQRKEGKDPVFLADSIPGLPKTECWHLEEVADFGEEPVKEYLEDALDADYAGLK